MTDIRNTSADIRGHEAALILLEAQAGNSDPILRMEAEGQRQLVNSDKLPTDMGGQQADFEAAGFTFGDVVPGDNLFRTATLPAGWRREASDHSMGSYLVDGLARRRVSIFYKAAFYDRSAHMYLISPSSYLDSALYEGTTPVLDDVWLTPSVAVEAVAALSRRTQAQINEAAEALESTGNTYWQQRIDEDRERLGKLAAMLAALPTAVPDGSPEVSA